jgi:hypothetical protein
MVLAFSLFAMSLLKERKEEEKTTTVLMEKVAAG